MNDECMETLERSAQIVSEYVNSCVDYNNNEQCDIGEFGTGRIMSMLRDIFGSQFSSGTIGSLGRVINFGEYNCFIKADGYFFNSLAGYIEELDRFENPVICLSLDRGLKRLIYSALDLPYFEITPEVADSVRSQVFDELAEEGCDENECNIYLSERTPGMLNVFDYLILEFGIECYIVEMAAPAANSIEKGAKKWQYNKAIELLSETFEYYLGREKRTSIRQLMGIVDTIGPDDIVFESDEVVSAIAYKLFLDIRSITKEFHDKGGKRFQDIYLDIHYDQCLIHNDQIYITDPFCLAR